MAKDLRIEPPLTGYPRLMAFNRISVERTDDIVLMHFGLLGMQRTLLDHYTCAIMCVELDTQKASLMDYLGKTGTLGEAPEAWLSTTGPGRCDICNFIGVCSGLIGEITLNNFVARGAHEIAGTSKSLPAQPVAVLKSGMNIHKHWIRLLFPE